MGVEAGFFERCGLRPGPSRSARPAPDPFPMALPDAAADFVAVDPRQADVEQDHVGPQALAASTPSTPSCAVWVSWPVSSQQHRQRLRRVLVVVDDQDRARRRRRRRLDRAPAPCGRGASDRIGSRTTNSLPRPCPSLRALDRAAVHLDEASAPASGRCPGRLRERSSDVSTCVNISKSVGSCSAAMPMPLSLHPDDRLARRSRSTVSATWPPPVGELAGVVEQVAEDLRQARRVAVEVDRLRRQRDRQLVVHARRERAGRLDRLLDDRRQLDVARLRSSILPRVMRLTSSRSSTRRDSWPTWRSIISDACAQRGPSPRAEPQRPQRVADRRERVAQLVGQHRQELVLAAVRLGQVGRELAQVVLQPLPLGDVLADGREATGRPRRRAAQDLVGHPARLAGLEVAEANVDLAVAFSGTDGKNSLMIRCLVLGEEERRHGLARGPRPDRRARPSQPGAVHEERNAVQVADADEVGAVLDQP